MIQDIPLIYSVWEIEDAPRSSGIYKIINLITGKFYIGSSVDFKMRWRVHINQLKNQQHSNVHLLYSWNKYGVAVWRFCILEFIPVKEDLISAEQKWIDEQHPQLNICRIAGSHLGVKRPEWVGRKISAALKGRKMSPEWIKRISDTKKSQHLKCIATDETRLKISSAMIGNRNGIGTKRSAEWCMRLSSIHKGKTISPEAREKMSLAAKARCLRNGFAVQRFCLTKS